MKFFSTIAILAGLCALLAPPRAAAADLSLGRARATDPVEFSVHLPLRNEAELRALTAGQGTAGSPFYHRWLTPAEFRAYFGPSPAATRTLLQTLRSQGFAAAQTSTQMLAVRGSAARVERLFSTKLERFVDARSGHRSIRSKGALTLPPAFARGGAIALKIGSATRPQPLYRAASLAGRPAPASREGAFGPYWGDDLKQAYQFPSYLTASGKGVHVAIVAAGDFSEADLTSYLQHERIGSAGGDLAPRPQTRHVLLPGAEHFDPNSPDSDEADLDTQQIAMLAPGATLTAFIIPPDRSDGDFFDAYSLIIESNAYDVVSTSYAECELLYTAAYNGGVDQSDILLAYNDLFEQGNAQGMTFVVGSGDNGALGCPEAHYVFDAPTDPPKVYRSVLGVTANADLPSVIGVGGGELKTKAGVDPLDSTYTREYGASDPLPPYDPYGTGNLLASNFGAGGGASVIFSQPSYQKAIGTGTTMRAVPDVGGHVGRFSEIGSYDYDYIGGQLGGVLGTSASTPDFAALLALKVQIGRSRLGLENTDIYALAARNETNAYQYFHDAIPGFDGFYAYAPQQHGYNFIYGVGSVRGAAFLGLRSAPYANAPQTASNP